jgi:hypothetical protein
MQTVNESAAKVSEGAIALAIRTADANEAMLYERLALKRLAELGARPQHGHPPSPPGDETAPAAVSAGGPGARLVLTATRIIFRALGRTLSILEPLELVQRVAPGKRPLARHEWEMPKAGPPRPGVY